MGNWGSLALTLAAVCLLLGYGCGRGDDEIEPEVLQDKTVDISHEVRDSDFQGVEREDEERLEPGPKEGQGSARETDPEEK
jgi:hypothetical protein